MSPLDVDANSPPLISERLPHSPSLSTMENVRPQLSFLSTLSHVSQLPRAPPAVKQALDLAVSYFTSIGDFLPASPPNGPMQEHISLSSSGPTPPTGLPLSCADGEILTRHNIQLNRQTTLETVYYYPLNTLVEYPETSINGRIGHVFSLDPLNWISPVLNFAYSLGGSHGMSQRDRTVKTTLLVDDLGEPVPCRELHTTCKSHGNFASIFDSLPQGQGCKICPYNDQVTVTRPHCRATRDDLHRNLTHTQRLLQSPTDLSQQLLMKTLSLWSSFCRIGCSAPPYETTSYLGMERDQVERWNAQKEKARRGHEEKSTCQGRLLFDYNYRGVPYVR
jgi:hypothetical protein